MQFSYIYRAYPLRDFLAFCMHCTCFISLVFPSFVSPFLSNAGPMSQFLTMKKFTRTSCTTSIHHTSSSGALHEEHTKFSVLFRPKIFKIHSSNNTLLTLLNLVATNKLQWPTGLSLSLWYVCRVQGLLQVYNRESDMVPHVREKL